MFSIRAVNSMEEYGEYITPIWEFDSLTVPHDHLHSFEGAHHPSSLLGKIGIGGCKLFVTRSPLVLLFFS